MHAERHVRILDADAGIPDYLDYLRAFHGFHAPIERRFEAHESLAAAGFAAPSRRRAHLIEADLAALGDQNRPPFCNHVPGTRTVAEALGVAYVLEGSTLGGRYIVTHLPLGLASVRGIATAFLEGYGEDTGAKWRAFGTVIDTVITTPELQDETVRAACATFTALIEWLAVRVPADVARGRRRAPA